MIYNWDDIQETQYINEEGEYTLKIMSHEEKETANGNDCHVYTCQTKDGEVIKVSLYLSEKALWKYKAFVKACGLPTTGSVNFNELPKSLVGRKFIGSVKRQPPKTNVATGELEESKYFEVAKFYPVEG
jgi:hypothetical protein